MSAMIKYRVHEVGKDFGRTSKEITQILTDYATTPKNHMQVLEDEELSVIFEYLTQHNQIESLEEVFKETYHPPVPEKTAPAAEQKSGEAAAPAAGQQAAPQQPKKEKEQKPHVPRKVAEKRVVDTRGATTNLSKYDQHLDEGRQRKAEDPEPQPSAPAELAAGLQLQAEAGGAREDAAPAA